MFVLALGVYTSAFLVHIASPILLVQELLPAFFGAKAT
jgi:hypothetical protein